jgi:hypothetical protein
MRVGKAVAAGDMIGIAGTAQNKKDAYVQLTVWHPEPAPTASLKTNPPHVGYELASLPVEFCRTDAGECRTLTHSQWVSRTRTATLKKRGERKVQRQ